MTQICTLPKDLVIGASSATAANLWHLPKDQWEGIWKKATGAGITVAVLDTGFTPHPDLPSPIAEKSFIRGESVRDGNGHGSHCCGTSVGRNGIGVAPEANLIVGKVLSNSGSGSTDGIADGVRWAVDQGADVISLSIGGGGFVNSMRDALVYAWSKGVITVAAAGNSGFNGSNSIDYPGKYLESVCVGAYRVDGKIANFSSGGRELDIACPGEDIISASHRGSGYVSMSGTSMATPFSAGVHALLIELQRREGHAEFRDVDKLRSFLAQFSDDAGTPGEDDRFGSGIPNSKNIADSLAAEDVTLMSI